MKKFLVENWFNVGSIIVSIVALLIALQSNFYARQANDISLRNSTPRLELINSNSEEPGYIFVFGCYDNRSKSPYQIQRSTADLFTFVNRGGLGASLIKVGFQEGSDEYSSVRLFELGEQTVASSNEQELQLPLNLNAGTAQIWRAQATDVSHWKTFEESLLSIDFSDLNWSHLPEIKKPALWKFEFSDGTVLASEYKSGWYQIIPNIDRHLHELNCRD